MSQQGLDVRRSIQIVWRYKFLVGAVVVLGMLAGGAYAHLKPPAMTSTALVVLPPPPQNSQLAAGTGSSTANPYTATQEVIAGSNQVLSNALPAVRPAMSLTELRRQIQIGSVTPYVISISAKGKTAADSEATANAVASSYVQYVNSASNAAEHTPAVSLERAASAAGTEPLTQLIVDVLLGAIAGLIVGAVIALAVGRRDRRLRARDELADSIGVSVLASLPVDHPRDAAGWIRLLEDYKPEALHALQLRNALHYMGTAAVNNHDGDERGRSSVTILSLASDPRAVALGPQLAAFAASQGLPTVLVIGPQQEPDTTATLQTACSGPPPASPKWPSQLRVTVSEGHVDVPMDAALTVVVCVVDGGSPRIPQLMRTTATVLGVSSGVATAEQLARVAVNADAEGREITGILVADPEPTDHTTGRIPQLSRPARRRQPTRLKGITTEITR
jgi:capsular polysaccharide biosynthesis protein